MATINTMEDLIQVLDDNPEWLEALRARLLTREVLEMPQTLALFAEEMREFKASVTKFVESTNRRFDEMGGRFDGQDARFDGIDARLDGHDARFDAVDARFDGIDARLDGHDARFDAVDARFDAVDARFDAVDARFDGHDVMLKRITDDLGQLKGAHARNAALEDAAIIARDLGLRRTKTLTREEILDMIEAADTAGISVGDLRSFRVADLLLEATAQDGEICYVAVEISYTANGRDTDRAIRNAEYLTKFTGRRSFAVVSGLHQDDRIRDRIESGELYWHQLTPEQLDAE